MLRHIVTWTCAVAFAACIGCGGGSSSEVASNSSSSGSASSTPDAGSAAQIPAPEATAEQPAENPPAETPAAETPAEGTTPDGGTPEAPPAETTPQPESSTVPEPEKPAEGDKPADGQKPAEDEKPAEGNKPDEAAAGAQAEAGVAGPAAVGGAVNVGGGSTEFAEGTPERALYDFITQIAAGGFKDLNKFISKKATGTLKSIRDGKLSETEAEKLKSLFSQVRLAAPPRALQGFTLVALETPEHVKIQFKLAKEGDQMVITEMTLPRNLPAAKKPVEGAQGDAVGGPTVGRPQAGLGVGGQKN